MSAVEIKPCPFCGDRDPCIDEIDSDVWAVCCEGCGVIGPHINDGPGQRNVGPRAIEMWNARKS